jgi:DNA-binding CsgD family transcriptional regulator
VLKPEIESTTTREDLNVTRALEEMSVPAYVLDREGRFRWQNSGFLRLFGNRLGQPYARTVAPEDLHLARTHFARKLIGEAGPTEYTLTALGANGERLAVRISWVPFREGGEIAGVFGIVCPRRGTSSATKGRAAEGAPSLTARQYEALALLADGLGTSEIARRLGVAEETARNHIRGLLRQLGVHSRLEAVVTGYRLGLLEPAGRD